MKIPPHTVKAFVAFNQVEVRLQRKKKVSVPGGGWKWVVDKTLPPQTARLVQTSNVRDSSQRTLPSGKVVTIEANLVFEDQNADVKETDEFDIDGKPWEVARVVKVFSVRAEVFRNG